MTTYFVTETKICTKNQLKGPKLGSRKLNQLTTILFILVLKSVRANIYSSTPTTENVRQHSSDEFSRFEIIKPTLKNDRTNRIALDGTRLEDGSHVHDLILHYVNGEKDDVIVDLKLNHKLVPHNHFMRYQLPNGTDAVQYFTKTDIDLCHYKGSIRNNSASHAAISTCYGIKGLIFDGKDTYYIDPKDNGNISDEHYLYRHSDKIQNNLNNSTCDITNNENEVTDPFKLNGDHRIYKRSTDQIIRATSTVSKETAFVELVLVVDNSVYRSFGRDFKKIHHYCKDIANTDRKVYVSLNIFIILVGVSVWNEKDRIHLSKNSSETLENFLLHRREVLILEHPNDNAHLLTNQKFERGVVGHARVNTICSFESSGGISNVHSPSASIVAATVAHELGHNFGMHHDMESCECEQPPCIMEHTVSNVAALHWSSCSKNQLDIASKRGLLQCLRNKPTESSINAICGNGFVEPGEECDCGLLEFCENPCCDANTCKLHQNASCATGECCDLTTCNIRTQGTVCRAIDGECDLIEHCTGDSEYCPENTFKRDTELCGDGTAYCYEGSCQSHDDQCKLLWGESGKSVDQCYRNNMKGDARGNCGKNWMKNTFTKCFEEDIMCGQLQCEPPTESNELEKSSRVEIMRGYSPIYPYFHCQAAVIDVGLYNVDPGLSPNGAMCGEGKMCIDQKCWSIESLRISGVGVDCPENCNGHGVCDNKPL